MIAHTFQPAEAVDRGAQDNQKVVPIYHWFMAGVGSSFADEVHPPQASRPHA